MELFILLKAVTNRDFPMLRDALGRLFGIELDYDPALFPADMLSKGLLAPDIRCDPRNRIKALASGARVKRMAFRSLRRMFREIMCRDPQSRIRIIFVDGVEDLSFGMAPGTNIIGFNLARHRLVFVGVPPELDPISPDCAYVPKTMDGYLLAVAFHELYENLTGDVRHCHNPGKCINSVCKLYENGTCCVCMGGLIDEKYPDLRLEDLFCAEDLEELSRALDRQVSSPGLATGV